MGTRRGVHPRSPQRFFSEKEASGASSSPDDRVRRPPPLSRRRRSAEILRFHLPQFPRVPHQDGSLVLAVTHKFPRGGICSTRRSHSFERLRANHHHVRGNRDGRLQWRWRAREPSSTESTRWIRRGWIGKRLRRGHTKQPYPQDFNVGHHHNRRRKRDPQLRCWDAARWYSDATRRVTSLLHCGAGWNYLFRRFLHKESRILQET